MKPFNYIAVGLDVDGVLADFLGYAYPRAGIDPNHPDWEVPAEKEAMIREICNDPATWVSLKPIPGAKAAVNLIYTATGCHPVFISSMPDEFADLRIWWLDKHFGDACGHDFEFYSAKSADKPEIAKQQLLTHFVEDKRTTANAMAMAGLTSILVPSPYYNDGDIHPNVQVKSLAEFARDLQTLKEAA